MTLRLAVFDCDGTLVDGQGAICSAMDIAFDVAGLSRPDRHAVRRIVGLSLPHAVRGLAPDADDDTLALVVEAYKSAYRAARADGSLAEPLFDGIVPLLDGLLADGWQLGVATGKSPRASRTSRMAPRWPKRSTSAAIGSLAENHRPPRRA